jgi:hypothetical protein
MSDFKNSKKRGPLSIKAFFKQKMLDYLLDNQAFTVFRTPQYKTQKSRFDDIETAF